VPASRGALFAHHLTEAGVAELQAILDSGRYRVRVPEEAALLVVAWLLRVGDRSAALALLDTIGPWADRLRFAPVPAETPAPDPTVVWRYTTGEVRERLAAKRPNPRVAAMNEALTVWNPFADELLRLWLDTVDGGRVAVRFPDGWRERAQRLLARYHELAQRHTLCTKHRRPKENLAILRMAVEECLSDTGLSPRRRGLLQHAVDAMVARRGAPGSEAHTALRRAQERQGRLPTHAQLAAVVAERLAARPADCGDVSVAEAVGPVTPEEARTHGVPVGWAIPEPVRRVALLALAGTVEDLVAAGLVPSAEVFARLVPGLAAVATAAAYDDPALRTLMAQHYRAFRARRSLLLLNLEHQVRIDELPWVAAVAPYRRGGGAVRSRAAAAVTRVAQLALQSFPATVMPNPLVRELAALSREADLDLPWVEELAADIFMGTFSAKFLAAAKLAATLLRGSLYQRYYGIDADAILSLPGASQERWGVKTSAEFDELCWRRAGIPKRGWSVAANGMVIEQAQVLTTHNLAVVAGPLGVVPDGGWGSLARASLRAVLRFVEQVHGNPRPLSTIKNAAYAWRQMLFYLSMVGEAEQPGFVAWAEQEVASQPHHVRMRLAPALVGLAHVVAGGSFGEDGSVVDGAGSVGPAAWAADAGPTPRRFLGWSVGEHWMLADR